MNRNLVCLFTGCTLHIPQEGKALHGDLHSIGSTYIFNGVLHGFDTAWMYGDEALELTKDTRRVITLREGRAYFDRRGVVVFQALDCKFNTTASNYLKS